MVTLQIQNPLLDPRLEAPEELFDPNPMRRVPLPDLAAIYATAYPLTRDAIITQAAELGLDAFAIRRDAQFSTHRWICTIALTAITEVPVTETYSFLRGYDSYEAELLARDICQELVEDRRFVIGLFQTLGRTMHGASLAELNRAFAYHRYTELSGLNHPQSEGVLLGLSREQVLAPQFDAALLHTIQNMLDQHTPEEAYNQALAALAQPAPTTRVAPLNGRINQGSPDSGMGR